MALSPFHQLPPVPGRASEVAIRAAVKNRYKRASPLLTAQPLTTLAWVGWKELASRQQCMCQRKAF